MKPQEWEPIFELPSQFRVKPTGKDGVGAELVSNRPAVQTPSRQTPLVTAQVTSILKWPTDTISIDYYDDTEEASRQRYPHTLLLFIPGNPGCVGWYTDMLLAIVSRLGVGSAARGTSYAGHGVIPDICNVEQWEKSRDPQKPNVQIPWTVDGQIRHKIAWIDKIVAEMTELRRTRNIQENIPPTRYIFISHSIGAHMVQRLCVLRKDILLQTKLLIHLMPFTRMDAPQPQQTILSTLACSQDAVISLAKSCCRLASIVPASWVDSFMQESVPDDEGRRLAVELIRQPTYAKNFFELGTEEVRDVPERPDDSALRLIGKHCPSAMLYCGGPDHWAPTFHMHDLKNLKRRGCIPGNVKLMYMPHLVHDFVVRPQMVPPVVDFCRQSISELDGNIVRPRSKL